MTRTFVRSTFIGLVLVAGVVVGGCTSARNDLGPHQSSCFRVLPAAEKAVAGRGRLAGVKYLSADAFLASLRSLRHYSAVKLPPALESAARSSVCLVAYQGEFTTADVKDGWSPRRGTSSGAFAIVVVRQSDDELLATVILRRAPLRLARVFPSLH